MSANGTQAIDRAAELLSRVVLADEPPAFNDLVSDTGLAKSTASRLLQALERHRLIHRDDAGGYEAGSLFAVYASKHAANDELIHLAEPELEAIGQATGETVNLAIARGNEVVQIAQVDSTYLLGTVNWIDVEVPAHCSALGKVFYASGSLLMPTTRMERRTEHTITTPAALRREIATITDQGYAETRGELEIGLDAIAVPVLGPGKTVIAAVGVSGPSSRLGHQLPQLAELLKTHAQRLSDILGHHRKEGAA